MLQITEGLKQIIEDATTTPFILVKLEFRDQTICVTDAPRDLEYENFLYTADGGLKGVSPPQAEADVSRDLFNIILTDATGELRQLLDIENIGVKVSVKCGFVDPNTDQIHPYYLNIYNGKISSVGWKIEEDSPDVTIQCSGPLTKLKQITNRTTTSSSQKQYHPTDTSLDLAYDSTNTATIKWGGNS